MKSSELAIQMCDIPAQNTEQVKNPVTPRVQFILDTLRGQGLTCEVDRFQFKGKREMANVYVMLNGRSGKTVVFLAHHDIINPLSHNLNDNTASVCNLMELAVRLKRKKLEDNVLIAFTDAEEPPYMGQGAIRLGNLINAGRFGKVRYAINLELTAVGSVVWTNDYGTELSNLMKASGAVATECPPNDSFRLRNLNIDSVCIGLVRPQDLTQDGVDMFNDTWGVCHSKSDHVDNIQSQDMHNFVTVLENLLTVRKPTVLEKIAMRLRAFVTQGQNHAYIQTEA